MPTGLPTFPKFHPQAIPDNLTSQCFEQTTDVSESQEKNDKGRGWNCDGPKVQGPIVYENVPILLIEVHPEISRKKGKR